MPDQTLVVTCTLEDAERAAVASTVADVARIVHLPDLSGNERRAALQTADALLARNTDKELQGGEHALPRRARLLQFLTAGIDFIPLAAFPPELPIASNGGAYAEPMAEHALAMAFAAAKRLVVEHKALEGGTFNQFTPNRMLAGATCGILGFGGIGVATARLMRAAGMKVHAINTSGRTAEPVDRIGTLYHLDDMLATSDVLVISLPLKPSTRNLITSRELGLMKKDTILVNMARGEIIDEAALFEHLKAVPTFTACIDAWWVEPVRHGRFEMGHPFMTLPNVIGSPHNSASVPGWRHTALERALQNVRRALTGAQPLHLIGEDERAS